MNDLSKEIAKVLNEYTTEVEQGLEKAKDKITKEGAKELRSSSPKRTGDYARGWTSRKVGSSRVVYNKNKPQVTHLLEKGHAKRGGGRVAGQPHIKPVEEKMIKDFEKEVERVIRG